MVFKLLTKSPHKKFLNYLSNMFAIDQYTNWIGQDLNIGPLLDHKELY